ncbi:extracellular solute-binding protein [Microbacterium sp. ASV81]|uniref:Extracellular solute-binding protein n=1 Tax=Microbacterium capsulatum TaxID=3041921 RepID=A0ABU0XKZ8_9MICO|nr:extracellular solute-binding protein [Microbacterium sp. ASV81]MDQ4215798.1 extracellular solute-binding protein [Microbacterium sp. ASV81]
MKIRRLRAVALVAGLTASAIALAGCSSAAPAAAPSATSAAPESKTLVVSTFPFGVDQLKQAVIDPFTKATGITVQIDTGSNSDRISKLQLAAGVDPGVDVMMISDFYAALGQKDDLFQKVDASKVPALKDIASFAKESAYDGPAYSYQLNGTLYRTDALDKKQAADWSLYGNKAYAGKLALPDIAVTAGQLTISGVGTAYGKGPYDVDSAFKTMHGWAPNVLQFYSSSTEVTNLITQKEIVAADALNGFATKLVASGEPIAWTAPSKGAYMATNRAMIPKGAAHTDAAYKFIQYLLGVEAQTASAKLVGDLPVNPGATIPKEIQAVVGDIGKDPMAAGYKTLDPSKLVPTRSQWVDRFAREVTAK